MKQKKKKSSGRRAGCALLVSVALILQAAQPSWVYAQQDAEGLCSHHPEHTEECGYSVEKGIPCTYTCMECAAEETKKAEEEAARKAEEEAARKAAQEAAERARQAIQQVQTLIDALPETDGITAENLETVKGQLAAVDTSKAGLTEEQQASLDLTRYTAAAEKVSAVEAEVEAARKAEEEAARKAEEEAEKAAQEAAERARQAVQQVQTLIDALPETDGITAENLGTVKEQLAAIDTSKAGLTEEQQASLDLTGYTAAAEKVSAVEAEQEEAARKAEEEAEKAAQEAAERARQAVQQVQTLIDALPTSAEVKAMSKEKQQNAYMQAQKAWDAYDVLTAEQQTQVDTTKLMELLDYFNGQVAVQSTNAITVATVTIGEDSTQYSDLALALNAANGQNATITILQNCDLEKSINITSGNITVYGGEKTAITSKNGADLIINGGTLNVYSFNYASQSGIKVKGGTLNVYSGNINTQIISEGGTANIYGGTVVDVMLYGGAVYYVPNSITLKETSVFLQSGANVQLNATVDQNKIVVKYGEIIIAPSWSSNNQEVATVDGSGKVTAVTPGTATITASAGGKTATCEVTVNPAPTIGLAVKDGGNPVNNIAYSSTVSLEASIRDNQGKSVTDGTVDFYRGDANEGNKLSKTPVPVNDGTAVLHNVPLTGEGWKPNDTAYTITAVYTPAEGSSLSGGSQTASLKIDKAIPEAPEAPVGASETGESRVVLASVSGNSDYGTIQYGYTTDTETEPGHWQDSNVFTNLSPGTDYTFYSRYSGNDFYTASKSTKGLQVTTLPQITTSGLDAGTVGEMYSQTLSADSGKTVTWSISEGALPAGLSLNGNTGTIGGTPTATADSQNVTIQATISDADGAPVSSTKQLTITIGKGTPTNPEVGEGYDINYEAETVTARDGYELSANGGDAEGSETLNVTPGTNVYVRRKATEKYHASNWTEVTIPARPGAPDLSIDNQTEGVTLSENYRYSFNGSTYGEGDWKQGSGRLIQVDPKETICIYEAAVNSGENSHFKSEVLSLTAPARAEAPSGLVIDYTNENLTGTLAGMQYRIGEDGSWTACESGGMALKQYFGWYGTQQVVYFRTAATNNGYASDPTQVTIPARPTLELDITNVSADGFTVTVKGAPAGAELTYRATGAGGYADYDSGEQTGGTFTGLKAGVSYPLSVKCAATGSSFSAEATAIPATKAASFTVSIPRQATAGGNAIAISIDSGKLFDLGADGKVNVKIKDEKNFDNGSLILRREGADNTIMSALSVGGSLFTDLSRNVAVFTENSKDPVSLSFAAPTEENIPAGNYTGTVNFEISYTQ